MTYLPRVAAEIKRVGLYDLVLQDAQKIAGKNQLSEEEILAILVEYPEILVAYKQINVEYNVSNIHLKNIDLSAVPESCHDAAKTINAQLDHMREIEKYTLDFEQSSVLVIIFSIEFFVLFSVQYFIVLLNLKAWQGYIYSLFGLSIAVAWWYAKKAQRTFARNRTLFEEKYIEILREISQLEAKGCLKKSDLIITECEDHA